MTTQLRHVSSVCASRSPGSFPSSRRRPSPAAADQQVRLRQRIQPIFERSCYSCHGAKRRWAASAGLEKTALAADSPARHPAWQCQRAISTSGLLESATRRGCRWGRAARRRRDRADSRLDRSGRRVARRNGRRALRSRSTGPTFRPNALPLPAVRNSRWRLTRSTSSSWRVSKRKGYPLLLRRTASRCCAG